MAKGLLESLPMHLTISLSPSCRPSCFTRGRNTLLLILLSLAMVSMELHGMTYRVQSRDPSQAEPRFTRTITTGGVSVGTGENPVGDPQGFISSAATGQIDLGTLGGYESQAIALNEKIEVVGKAQNRALDWRAFYWSPDRGMQDLNDWIRPDAGWVLTEAIGIDDSGVILGNGLLHGVATSFLLTPFTGSNTSAPIAILDAPAITNVSYSSYIFTVHFWDFVGISSTGIATNSIRVQGPNGVDQNVSLLSTPPSTNSVSLDATYYITPPAGGIWNATNNGTYTVFIEEGRVRGLSGNLVPAGTIGSFEVKTETTPVASISALKAGVMGEPVVVTLNAQSSAPYSTNDLFLFTVDWDSDGVSVETITATSGTTLQHRYPSVGAHPISMTAVDPHGLTSPIATTFAAIVNPDASQLWESAESLPGPRSQAIALTLPDGTLALLGGLPTKGNQGLAAFRAPGSAWAEGKRLANDAQGMGGGIDALGRIVLFGGLPSGRSTPLATGYTYSLASGPGSAIASKHFAVSDLAFATDGEHRIYSIGGTGAGFDGRGVERYDARRDQWDVLAALPVARSKATAVHDGLGHILVFGGVDPATQVITPSVLRYNIATDTWSVVADMPAASINSIAAVLGGNGLVYTVGPTCSIFDPLLFSWREGPAQTAIRNLPAATLGNDGFLYLLGGEPLQIRGNGLSSTERLETAKSVAPRILTTPRNEVQTGQLYSYIVVADSFPRAAYTLVSAPAGMTLNSSNGIVTWTPVDNQAGTHRVVLQASNSVGVAQQFFSITATLPPSDTIRPSIPTDFRVLSKTSTNITFGWSASTDNVGVHHYRLWHFIGSRSRHWAIAVDGIEHRSVIFPGGGLYAVSAVDVAGNDSGISASLGVTTTQLPVITHPLTNETTSVIVGSAFLYTLSASAQPQPGFSGFTGPQRMTFARTSSPGTNVAYAVFQWMPTPEQIGTNYFTVTATNLNARTTATFAVVVFPQGSDFVAPSPVPFLEATSISNDRCTLHWTPAVDNFGVANYRIQATHFGLPGQPNLVVITNVPGSTDTLILTGLIPSAAYSVTITPSDSSGNTGSSTGILVTTIAKPEIPLVVQTAATPGFVNLSWGSPGPAWVVTLESSDSLAGSAWTPLDIGIPWPATITQAQVAVDPSSLMRFFRVRTEPASP